MIAIALDRIFAAICVCNINNACVFILYCITWEDVGKNQPFRAGVFDYQYRNASIVPIHIL